MPSKPLRKAIIPAAGLGTRFLPATKAQPKEMLTVVDRPLIEYSVREAADAGVRDIILVTATGKQAVEDHFDAHLALERILEERGKAEALREVREISELASVASVRQPRPRGVGHAVLMARELIGDEPFAVMFPDDLILAEVPALRQLADVHAEHGGMVLAVQEVPRDQVHRYGVIRGREVGGRDAGGRGAGPAVYEVEDLVEKPPVEEAPSNLAIIGRYILHPGLFAVIEETDPGVGGEVQLTDAIRAAMDEMPCHAVAFEGRRFDCGNKLGFLEATVEVALRHPELGERFREILARRASDA